MVPTVTCVREKGVMKQAIVSMKILLLITVIYICLTLNFYLLENPESVVQAFVSKFEEQWFSYCNEELEKINMFFAGLFRIFIV